MKICKFILIGIISTIVFNGCVNNNSLTTSEINNIKSISVHKPKISKNSNFGTLGDVRTSKVHDSTYGIREGGALPSLIGSLIDTGIHLYKQNKFENKYKNNLSKINKYQIQNIDDKIELKILSVLKNDDFLSTKIVKNSLTFFNTKIGSFGLVRRYLDQNGEAYLGANINLLVTLVGEDGKYLANGKYMTIYSTDSYSVTELSNNNALIGQLFAQAYDNFEEKFILFIDEIFKNKKYPKEVESKL